MKGIYKIINLKTNKFYIGSSINMNIRCKQHFNLLKNNKHPNKKLQNSFNKNGILNFKFEIVETCDHLTKNELLNKEQYYIDNSNKKQLYNLTYIAHGGGYDVLEKELLLLNINGKIIKKFNSFMECSRFLNVSQINTKHSVNTGSIVNLKYRLVTPEFYNLNLQKILEWKNFSNNTIEKSKNYKLRQIIIYTDENNIESEFKSKTELSNFLGISIERIRQILNSSSKKYNVKHKFPNLIKNN